MGGVTVKLTSVITDAIKAMGARLHLPERVTQDKSEREMLLLIDEARREWLAAKENFDNVSDPSLIEHAVYIYHATEKRYMYLLNEARNRGLSSNIPLSKKGGR